MLLGNLEFLQQVQQREDEMNKNEKIVKLCSILNKVFTERPESKVIIFVQRRLVAKYLAEYLTLLDPTFKAKEFTSIGQSANEAGNIHSCVSDKPFRIVLGFLDYVCEYYYNGNLLKMLCWGKFNTFKAQK